MVKNVSVSGSTLKVTTDKGTSIKSLSSGERVIHWDSNGYQTQKGNVVKTFDENGACKSVR